MTDEERREVAARLQRIIGKCKYYYPLCLLYNEIIGGNCEAVGRNVEECDNECFDSLLARLADLIEPEERTCRIYDTDHGFEDSIRCDACQMTFRRPWQPFRFCPNCGARVIQE